MAKRIIVCGGRDYADSRAVYWALDRARSKHGGLVIIHGGARGADAHAASWAAQGATGVQVYEADWETHGKAAGPVRNQQMVDAGADGCIAFPGGRGTADMVARCRKAGIPVWEPEATSPDAR